MLVHEKTLPWLNAEGTGGGPADTPPAPEGQPPAAEPQAAPQFTIPAESIGEPITIAQPDPTQAAIQQMAAQVQNLQREILSLRTGKQTQTTTPQTVTPIQVDDLDPNAPVLRQLADMRNQFQTELAQHRKMLEESQSAQAAMTQRASVNSDLGALENVIMKSLDNIPIAKNAPQLAQDVAKDVYALYANHIKANPTNHGVTDQMVVMETQRRVSQIQGYIRQLSTANNQAIAQQVTANNATATTSGGASPAPGAGPKPKLDLHSEESWNHVTNKMREAEQRFRNAGVK